MVDGVDRNNSHLSLDQMAQKAVEGDRAMVGQLLSWVENDKPDVKEKAQKILALIRAKRGDVSCKTFRVGVTGAPGAGKSTLIDALGVWLCKQGHRVGVFTVDPSSSISGGSLLGDKTRMGNLALRKDAFIRPAANQAQLGGIHPSTFESISVLEHAGYDIVFVETVGVGQSEMEVQWCTDMVVLVTAPMGGDDLQAIKRGIIESVDQVWVNKDDVNAALAHECAQHLKDGFSIQSSRAQVAAHQTSYTRVQMLNAFSELKITAAWHALLAQKNTLDEQGIIALRRKEGFKALVQKAYLGQVMQPVLSYMKHDMTFHASMKLACEAGLWSPEAVARQLFRDGSRPWTESKEQSDEGRGGE